VQARQDELLRQFLTFQEQQLAFQAQQIAMMAALMAALGIQIPQIQLPGTSTVRPPTLAPQTQSQSQQPFQLPAQSQPFSTPQHQVSQGAISSSFEQVPQFTPLRSGFTPQSASASQLVLDSSTDPHLSFTYSALIGDPTPPPLQAPADFAALVTTIERLSSSVASSEQLAPSSTVPEMSATATESVPASSAGLEQPAQPVTVSAPPEQTQTTSPVRAASEGHSTSSASTADGLDDAARFEAVPRDSTAPPPPPTS